MEPGADSGSDPDETAGFFLQVFSEIFPDHTGFLPDHPDPEGTRGFRGKYRLTWTDASGTVQTKEVVVE